MPDSIFFRGASRCAISIFSPLFSGVPERGDVADSWSLPRARSGRAATVVDGLLNSDRCLFVCLLVKISLKAMRHVNRELASELGIHLFDCSFGVLFFPDSSNLTCASANLPLRATVKQLKNAKLAL